MSGYESGLRGNIQWGRERKIGAEEQEPDGEESNNEESDNPELDASSVKAGNLCNGCTEIDQTAINFAVDSNSAYQKFILSQLSSVVSRFKLTVKSKKKVSSVEAAAAAESLYIESWTAAWTVRR